MFQNWVSGSGWDGALFAPAFVSAVIAVWVTLIVITIRSLIQSGQRPGVHLRTARDILDEHLIRRDIDREEYVDRRKALDNISAIL